MRLLQGNTLTKFVEKFRDFLMFQQVIHVFTPVLETVKLRTVSEVSHFCHRLRNKSELLSGVKVMV
jgi:hypothetical protein